MKTLVPKLICLAGTLLVASANPVFAQGNAFTYQGRFTDNGAPYTGGAEFQATLWDAVSAGNQIAANSPAQVMVAVTNGLFVLPLNFGTNFPGGNRWLQLEVRSTIGPFTTLTPRQPLTPAPYAITADNLSGTLPAAQLSGPVASANLAGTYSSVLTLNNAANSFSGSGAGLTDVNALTLGGLSSSNFWKTTGSAGTTPGTHFLGTTDNQPLEIKVNGTRALRLEPTINDASHSNIVNVVGGSSGNFVGVGVYGATIGGGGGLNYFGGIPTNRVEANFGTVSGGSGNTIQPNAERATIGGGNANTIQTDAGRATIGGGGGNTIQTNASYATIGGGVLNAIQPNASYATLGGGYINTIQASAGYATLGGGSGNTIQTNAQYATIGGGYLNTIQTYATYTTIGGGIQNTIQTNASFAAIGGGAQNTIQTNAHYATIPGGVDNSAASYAFAAGSHAKANHTGAFVWADSQDADFASTANNQFLIRAQGGVGINTTNNPGGAALAVNGNVAIFGANVLELGYGVAGKEVSAGKIGYQTFSVDALDIVGAGTTGLNRKIKFWCEAGATFSGPVTAVTFNPSDRNMKENFAVVQPREVLEKVVALPLSSWNYKADTATRHIGPMAQDFYAAFNVGPDDKHIATVDADGVALAAIQGLNQKLSEQEVRLQNKDSEIQELRQAIADLQKSVRKIASQTQEEL